MPVSQVSHIHQELPFGEALLTEAWPRQDKPSRTEGEKPSRTGQGADFAAVGFDAAAGTGTACEGSTNVQSTLVVYLKKDKEEEGLHWHTLRGEQATGGA